MFCYLVVGRPRQGKSRYVKKLITMPETIHKPCMAYDFQNEYGDTFFTEINKKNVEVKGPGLQLYRPGILRSRFIGNIGDFLGIVTARNDDEEMTWKLKGYNIIFDEATIFFKGNIDPRVREFVVSKFHHKCNVIFVYHSLKKIPPDLIDLANFIVLFKTFDNEKDVANRFDEEIITEAFKRQIKKPDGAKPIIVDRYNNKIDGIEFRP